jgi:tRNA(Ile)-lysidine synthase
MRRDGDSGAPDGVLTAAAAALAAHVPAGEPLAVALSGGRDSVALLDALCRVAVARGHRLSALHIHHGLSPHADAWQRHCVALCAARGVPLAVRAIAVPRAPQTSLEAVARRLRYTALADAAAATGVRFVALAHHRDDQAETLLLQLLRGAGPHGLAGMPAAHVGARGVTFVRPLLGVTRAAIDEHARAAQLAWIEDESNAQHRHRRNAVRHVVMPALAQVFPQPSLTLARAAQHQADAARLADDLASIDAADAVAAATLGQAALAALPPHRARNLLRWFLHRQGLPAPSTSRLVEMLRQLAGARADAGVALAHAGVEVGVYRGRIAVHPPAPPAFDIPWCGEDELALPHGRIAFAPARGAGIATAYLAGAVFRVRCRAGGERLQLAADRPRRALSALLQEAGIPPWARRALPLVWRGDALAAAPGVGVDVAFAAPPDEAGVTVTWHPTPV